VFRELWLLPSAGAATVVSKGGAEFVDNNYTAAYPTTDCNVVPSDRTMGRRRIAPRPCACRGSRACYAPHVTADRGDLNVKPTFFRNLRTAFGALAFALPALASAQVTCANLPSLAPLAGNPAVFTAAAEERTSNGRAYCLSESPGVIPPWWVLPRAMRLVGLPLRTRFKMSGWGSLCRSIAILAPRPGVGDWC
jgi:hypothetical protein